MATTGNARLIEFLAHTLIVHFPLQLGLTNRMTAAQNPAKQMRSKSVTPGVAKHIPEKIPVPLKTWPN